MRAIQQEIKTISSPQKIALKVLGFLLFFMLFSFTGFSQNGSISVTGLEEQGETLTSVIIDPDGVSGPVTYVWQRTNFLGFFTINIAGANSFQYTLQAADVGRQVRVTAAYVDDLGGNESLVSAGTGTILPLNTPGTVSIAGQALQGEQLIATVNDADGISSPITYQWQRSPNGSNGWTTVAGQTNAFYNLSFPDVGNFIRVVVNYTDDRPNPETATSNTIGPIITSNTVGTISFTGLEIRREVLSSNITDPDGVPGSVAYQWERSPNGSNGWSNIGGANSEDYTLVQADVGNFVRVGAIYTDNDGNPENIVSSASGEIEQACDAGTTAPTIIANPITDFCDTINQDLNNYIVGGSGSAPSGAVLTWSTDNDPLEVGDHLGSSIVTTEDRYYGFYYDASNGCASPTVEVEIELDFSPNPGITTDATACSDEDFGESRVFLEDQIAGEDDGDWEWTSGPEEIEPEGGRDRVDFDGAANGTYIYTYTTDTADGACEDQSVTVEITVVPCCDAGDLAPQIDTNIPDAFCDAIDSGISLDDYTDGNTAPVGTTLIWSRNPDPLEVSGHLNQAEKDNPSAGTYYTFYYDAANLCASPTNTVTLTVNFTPVVTLTAGDIICGPGQATLTVEGEIPNSVQTPNFNWYDSASSSDVLSTSSTFNPDVTATRSFWVEATANGCTSPRSQVQVVVNIEPNPGITTNGSACSDPIEGPTTADLDDFISGQDPGAWTISNDPSGGGAIIGSDNIVNFEGLPDGNYIFSYTTNNAVAPCTDLSSEVIIFVTDCRIDTDNDGLTNGQEAIIGTDPTNPDTDGDTFLDGEEVDNGTDPLDACDPNLTPDCNPDPIDLEILKTVDPVSAATGEQITFTLTINNLLERRILDIEVGDFIQSGFEFVSSITNLGVYDPDTGIWAIEEMQGTDTAVLNIDVIVLEEGDYSNTAELLSSFPIDNNSGNDSATVTVEVDVPEGVDIAIEKSVISARPLAGDEVVFTILATNQSLESIVSNIVIEDNLLNGVFEYLSHIASTGDYNDSTGEWTIPTLALGAQASLEITARVPLAAGTYTNTTRLISSSPIDGNPDNNEASAEVLVNERSTEECGFIFNQFSPNGDGTNDLLKINCLADYPDNFIQIYNRYGNLIHEARRMVDGDTWDGTRNNEAVPDGTYFYVLDLGDGSAIRKGWIQIIR